jgi:hypothetical protein
MIRRLALGLVTAVAIPVAIVRATRFARRASLAHSKRDRIDEAIAESDAKGAAGEADEALAILLDQACA